MEVIVQRKSRASPLGERGFDLSNSQNLCQLNAPGGAPSWQSLEKVESFRKLPER